MLENVIRISLFGCLVAAAGFADVTLFENADFGGTSQTFYGDVPDLNRSAIGNDRASSIEVSPGCTARLYRDANYRGTFTELDRDERDLSSSAVGNDSVSSLRISCGGGRGAWEAGRDRDVVHAGVVLFRDAYYRGTRQELHGDVPDLGRTRFGSDQASSLQVAPGCRVRLYADTDYRGSYSELGAAVTDLGSSRVGNDRVSSVELRCGRDRRPWNTGGGGSQDVARLPSWSSERGVVLFQHDDFRGRSAVFNRDQRDLSRSTLGAYEASSIRVSPGCVAYLYSLPDFQGTSVRFTRDERFLGDSRLGNDRAASIQVECRRGSGGGGWHGQDSPSWNQDGRFGVTLYVDQDFRGASETFDRDAPSLQFSRVGNDRVTSVRVPRGCRVELYQDDDYRGRYIVLHDDSHDLTYTPVGNDSVSSLRVDCH